VYERRGRGDLHAGIDEPLTPLDGLSVGADHADVRGDDATGVDVDAGGLEVEDGQGVGPTGARRVIHAPKAMGGHRQSPEAPSCVRASLCMHRLTVRPAP
jgi:hypothetical protein